VLARTSALNMGSRWYGLRRRMASTCSRVRTACTLASTLGSAALCWSEAPQLARHSRRLRHRCGPPAEGRGRAH